MIGTGSSQNDDGAGKGRFRLLTISDKVLVLGDRARLGDVPRQAGLGPLGITHIRACLIYYGDNVDSDHGGVGENRE